MYRQYPNMKRSKEIKVKHVWRLCLFLGVCFWLIYQVKPSHDEKKGFDESDVEVSLASGHSNILVKLGRKGIHSRVEEMSGEDVEGNKHIEEDGVEDKKDEENGSAGMDGGDETFDDAEVDRENSVVGNREGEDVEGNKHIEEDGVEDKKDEENESAGMDGGDETFDDAEVERENSVGNREGGEGDENGSIEEKDSEDVNDQMEKESSVEERDHDGDDMSSHEAREEHYMADDASSAVSHDTRMVGMENENEHEENSNEQVEDILEHGLEENASEETDEGEKRKELEVEVGEIVKDDTESNVTYNEREENMWSNHHSETSESESEHVPEILTLDTSAEDLKNLQDTDSEKANYSNLNVDDNNLDSESTGPDETKISESEGTENLEEIQQDSIDSSDSSEEKDTEDVGMDLDSLPEIQTEGTNS